MHVRLEKQKETEDEKAKRSPFLYSVTRGPRFLC
jgi:hypothetical protein